MKILLKNFLAPMFLGVGGGWMADAEAGMEFESGSEVIEYCQKHHIEKAEVYYHFTNPKFDFSTKISAPDQD